MFISVLIAVSLLISWAPPGDFKSGSWSANGNVLALVQNGSIGFLDINSGQWTAYEMEGEIVPPLTWHQNNNHLVFSLKSGNQYRPVVFNYSQGSYHLGITGTEIRSLSWDPLSLTFLMGTENSTAAVPCSLMLIEYNPQAESANQIFTPVKLFPGRDGYILDDGNIACLAGNHLPPLRVGAQKPYKYQTGYAFILNPEGNLVSKIELTDDPAVWTVNPNGYGVYSSGNKVFFIEISSTGLRNEILVSVQTSLVNGSLPSALKVQYCQNCIYALWEIGSMKCLGHYQEDAPNEDRITCGIDNFEGGYANDNVAVLSGDIELGIYSPQGQMIINFQGGSGSPIDENNFTSESTYAISIQCPSIADLFDTMEILDNYNFDFLSPNISSAYQLRISRQLSGAGMVYQINFGSFNSSELAQPYLGDIENIVSFPVSIVEE
ncbi:MAG: hypothetical protein APR63_02550 [Desulfuromonas sp. SDB]|nr:MAG: hypothetical protein APR63_02550 [Desulfuromonas sp. SDB]